MGKPADYSIPGKKTVKLVMVTSDNNNKYYNMHEQADGTIKVVYGRIQGSAVEHEYPGREWDKIYKSKTKKGYEDITHLYETKEIIGATGEVVSQIVAISNKAVKALIEELQSFANKTIKENYTVSQNEVTEAQVTEAQRIIGELVKSLKSSSSVEALNELFLKLYRIVPRRMKNVRDHLVNSYDVKIVNKMIEEEQKLLDVMAGQVEAIKKQKELEAEKSTDKKAVTESNLLDIMGITVEEAKDSDIAKIKKLLGSNAHQFKKAFKVINTKTENRFIDQVGKSKNKKTEQFWHGSRNENWFNILQSGLLIRPSGVIHTGSMFGDGCYFADKAQKSIGYTSLSGSYWASGKSGKAYLAIYDVHVGEQKHYHKHTSECYSLNKAKLEKDGFDSVFAHEGANLRNNEYIVYDIAQTTIRYIVEIGN